MSSQTEPRIQLPKAWNTHVRICRLHVTPLAQFAVAYTGGLGTDSIALPTAQAEERTTVPHRDRRD